MGKRIRPSQVDRSDPELGHPPGRCYVVTFTGDLEPQRYYVAAEFASWGDVGSEWDYDNLFSRDEMLADPDLRSLLKAWERRDDSVSIANSKAYWAGAREEAERVPTAADARRATQELIAAGLLPLGTLPLHRRHLEVAPDPEP